MKASTGPMFNLLGDFALNLSLLFLMALLTTRTGERENLRIESPLAFDLQEGAGEKPTPAPVMVIDWDGNLLAVDGTVLGPLTKDATTDDLRRRVSARPGRSAESHPNQGDRVMGQR